MNAYVPRIGATGAPTIGTTFKVHLSRVPVGAGAALLLGLSDTLWGGIPLPFNLAPFGLPSCDLLVSPDFIFTRVTQGNASGRATVEIPIPPDLSLSGSQVFAQWIVSTSLTRALKMVVQ